MDLAPTVADDEVTEWDVVIEGHHYIITLDEDGILEGAGQEAMPVERLRSALLAQNITLVCSDGRPALAVAEDRITLGCHNLID